MEKYLLDDPTSPSSEKEAILDSIDPTTASVIASDFLALKSAPDMDAQRILKINNNEMVRIIQKTTDCETINDIYDCWYKINFQGNEGYVFGGYLAMKK